MGQKGSETVILNRIEFTLPYQPSLYSKNSIYRVSGKRVRLTDAVRQFIDNYSLYVSSLSRGKFQKEKKIYVDIMVFRSDMRADPANFIDVILDIIKSGIGVDDRWFSGSWNWEIDKANPRVEIVVSQRGD